MALGDTVPDIQAWEEAKQRLNALYEQRRIQGLKIRFMLQYHPTLEGHYDRPGGELILCDDAQEFLREEIREEDAKRGYSREEILISEINHHRRLARKAARQRLFGKCRKVYQVLRHPLQSLRKKPEAEKTTEQKIDAGIN